MCLFHFYVLCIACFFLTYFRAEYECFQIELSKNYGVAEWREDIKNCMKKAGLDNNPIVFLFSDTQVRLTYSPSPSFLPLSLPPSLPSLSPSSLLFSRLSVSLLFQIKSESFLEDINNILNSGDVPNIYPLEDLDAIYYGMKPVVLDAGLQPTKTNLFSAYTKRVRNNIHIVICMR